MICSLKVSLSSLSASPPGPLSRDILHVCACPHLATRSAVWVRSITVAWELEMHTLGLASGSEF